MFKKIRQWIQNRRDKRFLLRLERVLDNNILETNILFRGRVGGVYNIITADKNRGYNLNSRRGIAFDDGYTGKELATSNSRFEVLAEF